MITIQNGELSASIESLGAQLVSLKRGNKEYIWCGDKGVWGKHSPNLFPLVSRFSGNAYTLDGKTYEMPKHGFAQNLPFAAHAEPNKAVFTLCDSEETRRFYPFAFRFTVTYTLTESALSITYSVQNNDEKTMYYMVGGHTAFATEGGDGLNECALVFDRAADYYVQYVDFERGLLSDLKTLLFSGNTLPLNAHLFDSDSLNFPAVPSHSVMLVRGGAPLLRVDYTGFDALGIWSKAGTTRYVCIEPWSGQAETVGAPQEWAKKPNASSLPAGESRDHTYTITLL